MNFVKLFLFTLPMLLPISSYGLTGFAEKSAKATGPEIPASAKRPSHVVLVKNNKAECYRPTDNSLMPPWMQALPPSNPLRAENLSFKVPLCDNQEVALLKRQAPKMVLRKNSKGSNQVVALPLVAGAVGAVICGAVGWAAGKKVGEIAREVHDQFQRFSSSQKGFTPEGVIAGITTGLAGGSLASAIMMIGTIIGVKTGVSAGTGAVIAGGLTFVGGITFCPAIGAAVGAGYVFLFSEK